MWIFDFQSIGKKLFHNFRICHFMTLWIQTLFIMSKFFVQFLKFIKMYVKKFTNFYCKFFIFWKCRNFSLFLFFMNFNLIWFIIWRICYLCLTIKMVVLSFWQRIFGLDCIIYINRFLNRRSIHKIVIISLGMIIMRRVINIFMLKILDFLIFLKHFSLFFIFFWQSEK